MYSQLPEDVVVPAWLFGYPEDDLASSKQALKRQAKKRQAKNNQATQQKIVAYFEEKVA